ncbi:MAG: hypothetical protein ACKUBY_03700 [Candidatus Moraniibacteriota bacterium]|jgi:hypothetical protein
MQATSKKPPHYICPNNCEEVYFYQDGLLEATRTFDEDGTDMADETFDFSAKTEMKCFHCNSVAIINKS